MKTSFLLITRHEFFLRQNSMLLVLSGIFFLKILFMVDTYGQQQQDWLKFFEMNPQVKTETIRSGDNLIRKSDGALLRTYTIFEKIHGETSVEIATNYLLQEKNKLGLPANIEQVLKLESIKEFNSGTVVRYQQFHRGLKVDNNQIVVKLNTNKIVRFIQNTTIPIKNNLGIEPIITKEEALLTIKQHFYSSKLKFNIPELMIHTVNLDPVLCWRISLNTSNPHSSWLCYVDAKLGNLLEVLKTSCFATGTGNVFNPTPTYSAAVPYGTGNFIDNDDANNSDLEAEMINVTLNEIEEDNGTFRLNGPYASIIDPNGDFDNNSSNFNFTRDQDGFEAVMCYYYIDKSMRYVKEEFGISATPPYAGGLRFSPNDLAEDPTSYYNPLDAEIHFGIGGIDEPDVDAAEDAFVILHELGHALHHLISGSSVLSQTQGLSEGLSDYWGTSETRDCSNSNTYSEWQEEYHELFHWGIQPFVEINDLGRTTNIEATYNYESGYQWHYGGQFLSKALMRIYSDLGKHKTDLLVLESMPFLGLPHTNLQEAGAIMYETSIDLGYSESDICIVYNHFDDVLFIGSDETNADEPSGSGLILGDVYMKDTECDNGDEVNTTFEPLWLSEDIWVRHDEDGKLEHQNPEYKQNSSNWVYVRVRGRGCLDLEDATLRVYFTKASTGILWPTAWNDYYVTGPNGSVLAGDEITSTRIDIPVIKAGEEYIFSIPWYPPNPADFYSDNHHFCLLARIISEDDPMFITEDPYIYRNAKNNNNIAWKNISIFDIIPNNITNPIAVFLGCDEDIQGGYLDIQSAPNTLGKSIHELGNVFIELTEPFKSKWIQGGMQGDNYTVTTEGHLLVENERFRIEDIDIENCNEFINVYFEPFDQDRFAAFDIVQHDSDSLVIGGERFEFRPSSISARSTKKNDNTIVQSDYFMIYPNPTSGRIHIRLKEINKHIESLTIADIYGRLIKIIPITELLPFATNYQLDLSFFPSGIYVLVARDDKNHFIESMTFIKQ